MPDAATDPSAAAEVSAETGRPPWQWSAAEIAAVVRSGRITATAVLASVRERLAAVEPDLNALVVPTPERAERVAAELDRRRAAGETLGPLAGVPISIKECYRLAGTPTTLGRTGNFETDTEDAVFVRRLLAAGAVPMGKTNVPLMMIYPESDNPRYGRTVHPLDRTRSPGGSSGGEAALIAAGGSACGLANDLGGSIRVPASHTGLVGLKPTSRRLARIGAAANLSGLEALTWQAGPLTRTVADCEVVFRVICGMDDSGEKAVDTPADAAPWDAVPARPPRGEDVDVSGLTFGRCDDDGYFPFGAAARRAVDVAATALADAGATVVPYRPAETEEMLAVYFGIMSADGGASLRQAIGGSRSNAALNRLLTLGRVPRLVRPPLAGLLRWLSRGYEADLVGWTGAASASRLWKLTARLEAYRRRTIARWDDAGLDGVVMPAAATPALPHGTGVELIPAGAAAYLANVLGVPAGTVPAVRVGEDDVAADLAVGNRTGCDRLTRLAARCGVGSVGLPVGAQVLARHWREDIVFAAMTAIEAAVTLPPPWTRGPTDP